MFLFLSCPGGVLLSPFEGGGQSGAAYYLANTKEGNQCSFVIHLVGLTSRYTIFIPSSSSLPPIVCVFTFFPSYQSTTILLFKCFLFIPSVVIENECMDLPKTNPSFIRLRAAFLFIAFTSQPFCRSIDSLYIGNTSYGL